MTPHSLIDKHQCFKETCCLQLQDRRVIPCFLRPEDEGGTLLRNMVPIYPDTKHPIPEGSNLHTHWHKNLKYHMPLFVPVIIYCTSRCNKIIRLGSLVYPEGVHLFCEDRIQTVTEQSFSCVTYALTMAINWVSWFKTKILIIIWCGRGADFTVWAPSSTHCTAAVCSCHRHEPISVTGASTCH